MSEFDQQQVDQHQQDFRSLNDAEPTKDMTDLIEQSLGEVEIQTKDTFDQLKENAHDQFEGKEDAISNMLSDIGQSAEASLNTLTNKVVAAEADSSTGEHKAEETVEHVKETPKESDSDDLKKPVSASCDGADCPYYKLASKFIDGIQIPPKVKDMLLWKCPKMTGAVFSTLFVLLISVASCSLLTVVSSLMLLSLVASGSYRFYLAVMYRIKGTEDNTFEKLSEMDIALQKDKIEKLTGFLENEVNTVLKQGKSILLWDNITKSSIAVFAFYVVYCIGSIFNIVTICLMALVSAFTIPKFYQVYKKQIDTGLEKFSTKVHQLVRQAVDKVPMLQKIPMFNKKKSQ